MTIENNNYDIELKFDEIQIKVDSCNGDQIRMYKKNNIIYCESPICYSDCSEETSICKPGDKENINSPVYNKCECLPGLKGINCEEKIFIDFR